MNPKDFILINTREMKNKYTTFNNQVFVDIREPNTMGLFIYLWSGKFDKTEKDKLPSVIGMSKTAFAKSWKKLVDLGYVTETETGWSISDDPDTLLNHVNGNKATSLFNEVHPLIEWLNETCPRVQRMKQPITKKEAVKLMAEFHKEPIKTVFKAMENRGNLHSNYVSANLTVRSWIDDAHKKDKPSKYVPTA